MTPFADAYVAGDAFARGCFAAPMDPTLPIEESEWAGSVLKATTAYSQSLGGTAQPFPGPVVVTGQQTGILGGPLYTVLKAITAVQLAQQLTAAWGKPVTPVFWLAGDDHDFDEVSSVTVCTQRNKPETLRWVPRSDVAGHPMYRVQLDETLDALIDEAATVTRGSEWREPVRAFLRESRADSNTLCQWTGTILARLFAGTPLLFFAPHLHEARVAAAGILAQDIEEPGASTALLIEAGERLAAHGYPIPMPRTPDQCSFFVEVDGRRLAVRFRDGMYERTDGARRSPAELRADLEANPGAFSPGAALRPVVQQALFPVAAYVAGPGEIAYWAQLRPLFQRFALPMPSVFPRARAVLLSEADRRDLARLGWQPDDLMQPQEELIATALAATSDSATLPLLRGYQKRASALFDEALSEMIDDPVAQDMLTRLSVRTERGFARAERTVLYADAAQVAAVRERVARLQHRLAPHRRPQERVYGSVSWLFDHGWEFIPRLMRQMTPAAGPVQEIAL